MRLPSGSSRGWVAQAAPTVRLGALALLAAAVALTDTSTVRGSSLVLGLLGCWLPGCHFPWKDLGKVVMAGTVLFLSVLGTLSLTAGFGEGPVHLALAWGMACKGMALGSLAWATLHTFRMGALLKALSWVPGTPTLILEQIATQVLSLTDEIRLISQAWALREGTGRMPIGLLRAAPVVWLPRVAHRAERVAAAMELRGIPRHGLFRERERLGGREALLLALALFGLTASVLLRGRS